MGDRIEINSTGWSEVAETIREVSKKMGDKAFRKALRSAAKSYAKAVAEEAPRGETGKLEDGPKVRAMKRKKGRIGYQAKYDATEEGKFYATSVDRGAKNSGRSHAVLPPNPFMERAFLKTTPGLLDSIPQQIRQELEELIEKENRSPT